MTDTVDYYFELTLTNRKTKTVVTCTNKGKEYAEDLIKRVYGNVAEKIEFTKEVKDEPVANNG